MVTVLPKSKTNATCILVRTSIQTFKEITQHELVIYKGEILLVEIEDTNTPTQERLGFIASVLVVPTPIDTAMIRFLRWRHGYQMVI
jgi:hypothetical protein